MSQTPLRVVFAGTPEFAKVALQALINHQKALNIDIVAVYTQPDRKSGRGQKISASPVKVLALANNIAVEQPESFSLKSADGNVSRETLRHYRPDVMIVAAYGLILPLGVLHTPKFGCINIHGSLLPRWRGAAPIQRAILAGDDNTGITIMQMAQGLDTGDMLYKIACPITDTDTTQLLHDKLAKLGGEAIVTVLSDLENYQQKAEKQHDALANYAEKIKKEKTNTHLPAQLAFKQFLQQYPNLSHSSVSVASAPPPVNNYNVLLDTPMQLVDAGQTSVDSTTDAHHSGQKLILIAEDNPVNQKIAKKHLETLGYRYLVADDGEQAVKLLSENRQRIGLVLMDCRMPILDGIEATRIIRLNKDSVPIVALTANDSDDDRNICLEAGMDSFLTKPINKQKLIEAINHYMV